MLRDMGVNGKYIAKHMDPYTGLILEVTELVHPGENLIRVIGLTTDPFR